MPETTDTKRKYVRLDLSTWSEIEAHWEGGDVTLPELEERYGVSRRALQSHFAKRKLTKGAKAAQIAAAVKENVFKETLPEIDETTARAKETREAAYQNAVVVEQLIMAQLAAAQKDPSQAISAASAIKALSLAAAGLERLHQLKSKALGLDKALLSDDMTVLVFQDLTQEELEAIQDKGEEDEADHLAPPTAAEDDEVVLIDLQAEGQDPAEAVPAAHATGPRLVRGATQ